MNGPAPRQREERLATCTPRLLGAQGVPLVVDTVAIMNVESKP